MGNVQLGQLSDGIAPVGVVRRELPYHRESVVCALDDLSLRFMKVVMDLPLPGELKVTTKKKVLTH